MNSKPKDVLALSSAVRGPQAPAQGTFCEKERNELAQLERVPVSAKLARYRKQIREQERSELARELHDELGSLLTAAKLELATLKLRLDGTSTDTARHLARLGEIINSGMSLSRRVIDGLQPSSLTKLGLTASLEILAREFRQNTGIATATDLEQVTLDGATQLAAYRVVQESLNNTSKYAKATDARIVMVDCGSDVMMTVRDHGTGFETAGAATPSHGLTGMRHRVATCGGELTVSSAPGRGTLLVAVLPKRSDGGVSPCNAPAAGLSGSRPPADPDPVSPPSSQAGAAPGRPRQAMDDAAVDFLRRLLTARDAAVKAPISTPAAAAASSLALH